MSRKNNRGASRGNAQGPDPEKETTPSADPSGTEQEAVTPPDPAPQRENAAPRLIADGRRFMADLAHVSPNPLNIREDWEWEDDSFLDFAENIDELGVQQDPTVISFGVFEEKYPKEAATLPEDTYWVLGAGERRYRAALANGLTEMPMVLREEQVDSMDELMWSENQHRSGLHPLQEGRLLRRFRSRGLTADQIRERLGRRNKGLSEGAISKKIRLFEEVPEGSARRAIGRRELGVEPAYTLLTHYQAEGIEAAYQRMLEQKMTAKALVDLDFQSVTTPAPDAPGTDALPDSDQSQHPHTESGSAAGEAEQETSAKSDAAGHIPTQPAGTTTKRTQRPEPNSAPSAGTNGSPSASDQTKANDLRLTSAAALLASDRDPAGIHRSICTALINNTPAPVLDLARTLLGDSPDDLDPLRLAEAIAVADAEIRLAEDTGGADLNYLRELVHHGYQPTPGESDLLNAGTSADRA
ncbi:ParB N-terminal domain-containing protein [Kitasatospora sp. NPDC002965]|uniref:ParB N-terminal domain-containing protein n=1 Tax=Kitasatospora sp. NPDC002965 TaxID=3154775 RepID=UPI0033B54B11